MVGHREASLKENWSYPNFKMSFIIAHSQILVEGIMGIKSTFDQVKVQIIS